MRRQDYATVGALVGVVLVVLITWLVHPEHEWFFELVGWWVMTIGLLAAGWKVGEGYFDHRARKRYMHKDGS